MLKIKAILILLYFLKQNSFFYVETISLKDLNVKKIIWKDENVKVFDVKGKDQNNSFHILFNSKSENFRATHSLDFCKFLGFSKQQYFSKLEFIKLDSLQKNVKLLSWTPCCSLYTFLLLFFLFKINRKGLNSL